MIMAQFLLGLFLQIFIVLFTVGFIGFVWFNLLKDYLRIEKRKKEEKKKGKEKNDIR